MVVSSNEIEHDMNNQKIINLAAPTNNNDSARKIYVDNSISTDITTHSNLTTGIHGVTGTVVGTEDNVNVLNDITSVGANIEDAVTKRHVESHNAASHSDIASTGANIDDAVSKKHDESHTITSHSDIVDATGANIEELTGGGDTVLHDHDGISENTAARHAESHNAASHSDIASTGANIDDAVSKKHDESHTITSHSDIVDATGANIEELTGGGDTVLHDHDGISENTAARHAESHNAASHSDIASTGANIDDAVTKKHTQNTDTTLGSGAVAANHGAAATDQIINVSYGTGAPPTASDTTEGSLFVKYTA